MTLSARIEEELIKNNIEVTGSNQIQTISDKFWSEYSKNPKIDLGTWIKVQVKRKIIV